MLLGLGVDRAAHLLRARGANGAPVLVEAQAAFVERQAAVREQASHLGLEIVDGALVDHPVHAPRQHAAEVRHVRDVVAVVATDVVERVREVLSAREVLLEDREATRERVAARVHDLRVRQNQLDEAHVCPVVRHLVDEIRRARLALYARLREVALAERAQFVRAEILEHLRVLRASAARALPAQLARHRDQVRQLLRALDERMTREDLLEQGRARARQTDDEDRIGRGQPMPARSAKNSGVKNACARFTCAVVSRAS